MMTLPTILVLNGILMMPALMPTPLSLLVNELRADGFRVIEDSHFVWAHADEEPVIIIGHSQGGGTALRYAARLKREAKYQPLVITFDAVPTYRCPTRCINFQTSGYKAMPVPGAQNIDVDLPSVPLATHTAAPLSPEFRARVRKLAAPLSKPMN
jgi:pimeloyl-ACP methyl ester carboxylesterase